MLLQGRVRDLPFCDTELLNLTGFPARKILRGEEDENSEGRGLEICAIAEEEEEEAKRRRRGRVKSREPAISHQVTESQ